MNIEEYENELTTHETHVAEHTAILQHIEQHIIIEEGRRTGRTNKMILQAVTVLSERKHVYIVAPNRATLRTIRDKVEGTLYALGMNLFNPMVHYVVYDNFDGMAAYGMHEDHIVFYDHTCVEFRR